MKPEPEILYPNMEGKRFVSEPTEIDEHEEEKLTIE